MSMEYNVINIVKRKLKESKLDLLEEAEFPNHPKSDIIKNEQMNNIA